MESFNNTSAEIFSEQVRLLFSYSKVPLFVSVFASAILCWSQWDVANHLVISLWCIVFLICSALRMYLLLNYHNSQPVDAKLKLWHSMFLAGTYVAAAAWGSTSFLFFPETSSSKQVVFFLIMTGIGAGAISSLCPSLFAVSGFLSLTLVPLAIKMMTLGGENSFLIGSLILLFWIVILVGAVKINGNIRENIMLRLQSIDREKIITTSEERYRHIFNNSPLGIIQYDADSQIVDCNEAFANILGSSVEKLIGFNMLKSVKQRGALHAIKDSLTSGYGYFEGDYHAVTSGKITPVRAFFTAINSSDQSIVGGVGIMEDFTEKRLSEQQIQYHTTYDQLTGLPNRRLLLNQLKNEMSRAERHGYFGALLFLDLDNFKTINDSLGHFVGDKVLKLVSRRLADNVRGEDSVARMGGDEFILILTELDAKMKPAAKKAREIAEKLSKSISAPCQLEGHEMHITPSIGVSLFPKPGVGIDDILKQADTAMYKAKAAGRNEIQFFLPEMQEAADKRLRLNTDIRRALQDNEFNIHYQPQVDKNGVIIGAEALLRWYHPEKGIIPPGEFLKIAEETGLMWDIGQRVFRDVCQHIKIWDDSGTFGEKMSISVNFSGIEFAAPDFINVITKIVEETGVDPRHLGIEITEGSLISTRGNIVEKIMVLRQLGIKFSVDDFGTGYSSLAYLKDLPLNTLKIDRSFVNGIKDSLHSVVLVDTIIMMAHNLSLEVIAEGVETKHELDYLR